MRKFLLTLLMLVAAVGWASADEILAYTIDFCGSYSNTTALSASTFSKAIASGADYISSVTTNNCYAESSSGIRVSAKSTAGSIVLSLSDAGKITATSIKVTVATYGSDTPSGTIAVNSSSTTKITAAGEYTYTVDDVLTTITIKGATSSKRFYLQKIEVYKEKPIEFSDVIFTYNGGNYKNGETISAKEGEKITIFSEGATALEINGQTYDDSEDWIYTVTSDETQTISVTPIIGETKETESSTVTVNKKADDALDAPVITGSINETLPSGAYHPQTITISSTSNLGYSINGKGELILKDGETGKASVTIEFDKTYLDNGLTITAYSIDDDLNDETKSETVTREYTILRPDAPTFSVESGGIVRGNTVTISATGDDLKSLKYTIFSGDNDSDTNTINLKEGESTISVELTISEDTEIEATAYDTYDIPSEAANASYTAVDPQVFKLVTSADELHGGDKVIIASGTTAMSTDTTGDKRMLGTTVTISSDNSIILYPGQTSVLVFSLYCTAANTYYFNTTNLSDTQKCMSLNQSSNALTLEDLSTVTTSVAIASNNDATLSYGSRTLRYNSSMFRGYTSSAGTAVQLYRLDEDFVADNSSIEEVEISLGKASEAIENEALTEEEGFVTKYPAYYNDVNEVTLSLTIKADKDSESTYDVTIIPSDSEESISASATSKDVNVITVPYADSYSVTLNSVTTTIAGYEALTGVYGTYPITATIEDINVLEAPSQTIGSGSDIIALWNVNNIDSKYNAYLTFNFQNNSNYGIATEDYTKIGLQGYKNIGTKYDADTETWDGEYDDATNNWAKIAAQQGLAPINFSGVKADTEIAGTISVVYPFAYKGEITKKVTKSAPVSYTVKDSDLQTGVESILVNGNGKVEYFNLQGVRVMNPANGVYIRRQGNSVDKVFVK